MSVELIFTDGRDARFAALCRELDQNLLALTGGKPLPKEFAQLNATDAIDDAVLVFIGGQPVACGAYRHYGKGTAEIKRVFVKPAHRGLGIGKRLMAALEQRAIGQGYARLILETGSTLHTAILMYQALGYTVIANYGIYSRKQDSTCMEKRLPKPPEGGGDEPPAESGANA